MVPGGDICVDFFFLLSGYLMMQSIRKRHLVDSACISALPRETVGFIRHKIHSFYPELLVASLIALLSEWLCSSHLSLGMCARTIKDVVMSNLLLLNMTGLAGWGLNGAVWYLSSLVIASLIVYPVYRLVRPILPALLAACLLIGLMWLTGSEFFYAKASLAGLYIGNLRAVVELFVGGGLYECSGKLRECTVLSRIRVLFYVIKMVMLLIVLMYCLHPQIVYAPMVMLALCGIIVLSFALSTEYGNWLQNRYVAFLGTISLSVYLGHEFIAWRLNIGCFSALECPYRLFLYYFFAMVFPAIVYSGGRLIRCICRTGKESGVRNTM